MEWLLDALIDSAKLLPFLFVSYILIELIESWTSKKVASKKFYKGNFGPLIGSSFGMIPQCGFSVVATDLYSKQKITMGTLIAIFIATSDEALPILFGNLTNARIAKIVLILILSKFVLGLICGYLVDILTHIINKKNTTKNVEKINEKLDEKLDEKIHDETAYDHHHDHNEHEDEDECHRGCCGHNIEGCKVHHPAKQYLLHPLIHTLKIFAYILIVNIVFSLMIYYIGEENITNFLTSTKYFAPFFATLIGLIPNCASSVVLTNLLVIGGLNISACLAGLIVNAGIAYLILFKQNKNIKVNFLIIGIMAFVSLVTGYVMMLCGI